MKKVLLLLNEHEDPPFLFQFLKVATNNRQSLTKNYSSGSIYLSGTTLTVQKLFIIFFTFFFSMIRFWIGKLFWMTKPKILMIIPS